MTVVRVGGWLALCVALGCGGSKYEGAPEANLTIDAQVIGSTPVRDAAFTVSPVSESGAVGNAVASGRTDAEGRFQVELGVAEGTYLIETFGGTTTELRSGEVIELDADVRLSMLLLDLGLGAKVSGVVVSPMTTMAESLGHARLAAGKDDDFVASQARAFALLGAHFGDVDLEATIPVDPTTTGAGTLTESARYGLALASLSELSQTIAARSSLSAQVVNTIVLTESLAADLASSEALFDGVGADGPLSVGDCPVPDPCPSASCRTICDLGPTMLRAELALALDRFIGSSANGTGLEVSDVRELRTAIAENSEPELFGDAPIDTLGPSLTLDGEEYYVDSSTQVWWTTQGDGPLAGTVSVEAGDTVEVTVQINDEAAVDALVLDESQWLLSSRIALRATPQVNSIRVVATDGAGNQTVLEQVIGYDASGVSMEFVETTIIDEREDTVEFGDTPPVHSHPGPSVALGAGAACANVYKHINLLDPGDANPLRFRVRASSPPLGIEAGSVAYRVRIQGASEWLTDWTTVTDATDLSGGLDAEIVLTRDLVPELAQQPGRFELVVRASDVLGRSREIASCWNHNPLGPPLRMLNPRNGTSAGDGAAIQNVKLGGVGLDKNNLAAYMNGVDVSAGRGIMLFDVVNPHDEAVYFEVALPSPNRTGSITKKWKRSVVRTAFGTVSEDCNATPSLCSNNWPYGDEDETDTINATQTELIRGTRVWNADGAVPVASCAGCGANRYLIPARSGDEATRFTVMLVATNLSMLFPGARPADVDEFTIRPAGSAVSYQLTGNLLQTFSRCTKAVTRNNFTPPRRFCTERSYYRRYMALTSVSMVVEPFDSYVMPSVSAVGPAAGLKIFEDKHPANPRIEAWATTDSLPDAPPGA